MRYTTSLRLKNPGPAKFLIEIRESDTLSDAVGHGWNMLDERTPIPPATLATSEHFFEITDETGRLVVSSLQTVPEEELCSFAKRPRL